MKILVINGDCIQTNSSANLCHLAYIRGLLAAGNEVTLLSADGRDYKVDPAMEIPEQVVQYTIYGVSIYEKLSLKKQKKSDPIVAGSSVMKTPASSRMIHKVMDKAKSTILSFYGVHGIYATFVRKAQKFKSDEDFDYIISISTPVTSHLLTYNLLKAGHIRGKHWIQIWEDPWYSDAYGFNSKEKIRQEEKRLLSFAEKVCYVSPLTLENQKRLYPESAQKMFWQPLPYYYKNEQPSERNFEHNTYGYFGAYYPATRNLEPFYQAAIQTGIEVNICGDPCNLFQSTTQIHIHPRLPLNELKPIEDSTNVLIFLCNRKGGQIPGKIYQYSATNKTILFIMDGTEEEQHVLKEYFGKFNRYVFCQNTTTDIARAIRKVESRDLGNVQNVPLDDFDPVKTITNILDAGR